MLVNSHMSLCVMYCQCPIFQMTSHLNVNPSYLCFESLVKLISLFIMSFHISST